jgi:hypothetical protein
MSKDQATATRWVCDRCEISCGLQNGDQTGLPGGWVDSDEGKFCLTCRRERAAEEALDAAPEGASHKIRADLRRDAILGFEVTRDPSRPNAQIAQACKSSVSAVASTRDRLDLPEAEPRPRRR